MNKVEFDSAVVKDICEFYNDPVGFVKYVFPWGEVGSDLEEYDGADFWQEDLLRDLADSLVNPEKKRRFAVSSGHGIGKGAVTAWIIIWFMSTRANGRGVVTANTFTQLNGKTWAELALWHKRVINKEWFTWTATRFFQKDHPETWFVDAIANNANNSEAFAGLHARDVLVIFDEASGIDKAIYEVTEGAMTTEGALWVTLGNPTRNTGSFRESFGKFKHRWNGRYIDSRSAKMTDKQLIAEWEVDHGEDSDFFKVRVRGEFPSSSNYQLIGSDGVTKARAANLHSDDYSYQPIIIGCDVARFGDDETVIAVRQGRKQLSQQTFRGLDNVQVAMRCAEVSRLHGRATLLVDGVGLGAGVVDTLKNLGYPVVDIISGARASEPEKYFNIRSEMWYRMSEWFKSGADIIDDPELDEQLIGLEYKYTVKEQVQIEKKEDMKDRGLSSPDRADALGLTFAQIVHPEQVADSYDPPMSEY